MISEYAVYGETKLSDMGIYVVRTGSGLIQQPFLGDRELITEQVPGNDIPYVFGYNTSPLRFKLQFSTLDGFWTPEKRREFARVLDNGKFNRFYSEDDSTKWYYITYIGGIDIFTNGIEQGYLEAEFQNISPYSYSPIYSQFNDLSTITSPTIIEFKNYGDNPVKPSMVIQKIGAGDISIKNYTDGAREFKFTNLDDQEEITIDNENRIITSNTGKNRIDSFNGIYMVIPRGVNRLEISSPCKIEFTFQLEMKG